MDHLIDAFRYALMMKRHGKPRRECDGIGYGNMPYAGQRRDDFSGGSGLAKGVDFDVFTGQ